MEFFNKYSKKTPIGLLVILLMVMYSCKDLTSVNQDKNQPSNARSTYLMTSAQKNLADNFWGEFPLGYFGNLYGQYWSQDQYTDESRYSFRTGVINNIWDRYYTSMNTLQQIIQQNRNTPNITSAYGNPANQIAAAKILKAWTYQTLTDIWGDIPYGQALGGSKNPSPAYTSQDSVYMGIINTLTEASDSISVAETAFNNGDIFFDGDAAKWKKFANSLKMRAAIRIADGKPQLAEQAFKEAFDAGAMTSNDDNALFVYQTASPNNNPINEAYKTRDDFAVSNTLFDFMNAHSDPRRSAYGEPATNQSDPDAYIGYPYGLTQGIATPYKQNQAWSRPSELVRSATFPAIFMTYSEVLFAEAEAAQRGWISADAAQKYRQAIQASMDFWEVSGTEAQQYINANPYQPGKWRTNLGRQKWVALYMQGIQGWSLWRRLNFGLFNPPAGGKLGVTFPGSIAIRYPYPTQEKNLNGEHVNAAIDNQGFSEDDQGQMLWWDKAAESANQ